MKNILKTSIFPGKYLQGCNAIYSVKSEIERLDRKKPFIICDAYVYENILDEKFKDELSNIATFKVFSGECTDEEIESCSNDANRNICDIVVGIGGGKTLDTAKAVASQVKTEVIIVPTSASTDAPCSALSVIYNKDGSFKRYVFFKNNPSIVIADSKIISRAPVRLLVSGMGDALATWFEAESCRVKQAKNMAGGAITQVAITIAKLCYDIILKYGKQAKISCAENKVTEALENVIEANILLSGIGFESGGLAAAHAIHNGLSILPETHHCLHGEKVVFGLLTSLFLTSKSTELINTIYKFCLEIGLPITFADIGLDRITDDNLLKAVDAICVEGETIYNEPLEFTKQDVLNALKMADSFGRKFTKN